MELHQNREFLKGAVTGILYNEQQGAEYPYNAFTFNILKEGSYWEIQFIFTEGYEYKATGVYDDYGRAEYGNFQKTNEVRRDINEDCNIEDLSEIVKDALSEIVKREYKQ